TLPPVAACETYVWKGKTYITSGIYKDTTKNAAGCDSIITLNLTINHSTTHNDTIKACAPYLWYGNAYTTSGIYKDTIKNKAGCDSLLTLNLTITHVNATVTVLNNVITADSIVDSYQWIDCQTNLPISGETGKVFTATAPSGSYAVIETKNGCVDTSICTPIVITGIASIDKDQLHLYPNPGAGLYTLSLPEKATVTIISLTGEIVYNEQLSKGVNSIDLLKTANGIYIVHVTSAQTQQVLRLIKQE
ncbi:MAG TPA: T9SS type A sorting domain-containing protein, partial [Bacteroidia bacterium]|nr:T9SS type A sorting domain-containing protein [Bacteroidia bacterium]